MSAAGEYATFKAPCHQPIERADIRVWDKIRVVSNALGAHFEVTGVVGLISDEEIRTAEGGCLWGAWYKPGFTFTLLDRPKPKLPTEIGAVIIADHIEGEEMPLVFREGDWEALDGKNFYSRGWVNEHPWRLAEVKAVEA